MSSRWQRVISLIGVLTLVIGTLAFARPETFAAPGPSSRPTTATRAQETDPADPTPVAGATAATTTDTNLWSGPGTDFNLLLLVPALSTVTLTGNSMDGYWEVVYRSVQGWIDANDLVMIGQPTAPAQAAEAPAEATTTESPSPSPEESPAPSPAESPSPSPSPSEEPSAAPSESPSPSPSPSESPSSSPSPSPSASPAPSPSSLPSPPAAASPSPSVSPSPSPAPKAAIAPTSGAAGTPITLTVSGFAPGERLAQYWGDAALAGAWGDADDSGAGTIDRKVPNVAPGDYTLTVKGITSGRSATTTFTVSPVQTSLIVSPVSGTPGTAISLNASGFLPGEQVAQYWGDAALAGAWGTADTAGTAPINRKVPNVGAGDVTLRVVGQTSGRTASTSFTVIAPSPSPSPSASPSPSPSASPIPSPSPSMSPSPSVSPSPSSSPAVTVAPSSGVPGAAITLTATGFKPGETVAQYWGNAALAGAWGTADDSGTAAIPRTVPNVAAGLVNLRVVGLTSGRTAGVPFTVTPGSTGPSPSPSPGTSPPPTEPHGTATTTDFLNLRTGPGTDFGVIVVMPPNALVTLTGKTQNGFLSVHYEDLDGWASADYLNISGNPSTPPSSPPPSQGPTTGPTGPATVIEALNLRSGPAIGTTILTVMPAEATVTLTGKMEGGYLAVQYQGTNGWAASAYLDKSASGGGEHWIDVDRTHGLVRLYVGNKVTATYQGYMSADKSNDGFYATAIGTYSVYDMNADLTWTDYGGVFIADWVGFDPERYNGFHSYPMDANGNVLPGATGPSHGCVRLAPADAQAVYGFAYLGMRVVVHW